MTQLSRAAFLSKWEGKFADNITRDIIEQFMREFAADIKDSFLNGVDYSPSSSFGGLTGEVYDSQKLVAWGASLVATVRGGAPTPYNTLLKLLEYVNQRLQVINGGNGFTNVLHPDSKIVIRRDFSNQWSNFNPILALGEMGIELPSKKAKIGDGITAWNSLQYWHDPNKTITGGNAWPIVYPDQRVILRRDTALSWSTHNPILALGEMGLEIDTRKAKVGDGLTTYNSLPYWFDPADAGLKFKGYFVDEADLIAIHPTASDGDAAINLDTNSFWLWDVDISEWVDSTKPAPSILVDAVAVESSTNAAQSGDLYAKAQYLLGLISVLTSELEALEYQVNAIPAISKDEWNDSTPASNVVTIDFENKQNVYAGYVAAGTNYTLAFTNSTSYEADEVVNLTLSVEFGAISEHTITLPAGDHIDSEGTVINVSNPLKIYGSTGQKKKIYAIRKDGEYQWFASKINTTNGGTP